MHRLKNEDLEHQHVIEGWPPALRSVRARHSGFQRRPKPLEIDESLHALQIVALGRPLREPLVEIKQTRRPIHHVRTPLATDPSESINRSFAQRFLEVSSFI